MHPPFIFVKNGFIFVKTLTLVMTSLLPIKAIRRVNDKIFSVLILQCQQMTHNKTICEGKPVRLL